MPGKKKTKVSQRGGENSLLESLERGPLAQELAAKGFPPVQFTARMSEIMSAFSLSHSRDIPPPRAIHMLQGVAGAMAARVPDAQLQGVLRQQLDMFDDVLASTEALAHHDQPPADEPATVSRAWELLNFAASLLNWLQDQHAASVAPAFVKKSLSLSVSPDEFRALVEHGCLAPDALAALIPSPSAAPAELPFPLAAETCFFLTVAVIEGTPETRQTLLTVAERLAEVLSALRPAEAEDRPPKPANQGLMKILGPLLDQISDLDDRESPPAPTGNGYQLKIALKDVAPPIWRRIVVPDCTLATLDEYVRLAMGWNGGHLSCFEIDRVTYSAPHPFTGELLEDSRHGGMYTLGEFASQGKKKLRHSYDFGDGWEHTVTIEKILRPEKSPASPACIAGARACPPEDCGGPWGYQELIEARKNPKLPENKERLDWLGRKWDPEQFNPKQVTAQLRLAAS